MRRFRLIFLAFALALLAFVGLLVERALRSIALEREMRHQALAERVFDEMERGLSRLLEREEQRPPGQYTADPQPAPFPFVMGYFQADPDGGIRTAAVPRASPEAAGEIEGIVNAWRTERRATTARGSAASQSPGTTIQVGSGAPSAAASAAARLLNEPAAKDVSAFAALRSLNKAVQERQERQQLAQNLWAEEELARPAAPARIVPAAPQEKVLDAARSDADRTPLTGRVIDGSHLVLSRTIVQGGQAYRQGLLVDVQRLGVWLRDQGVGSDTAALAPYATVSLLTRFSTPPVVASATEFLYQHRFAEPFADLTARLALRPLPGIGSTSYVYALCALLVATAVLGLAALYRMVSVVVGFAERRSNFVAAVSHELKTPLTAIRMYGEMLRDGMVPSEAKRDEYYRHITVESERLSRLINNVLEFSRLEKGTREMALVVGSIAPVVQEVADLLRPHLQAQGFELHVEIAADCPPVRFERDALMQVLWNLVDNAVKYSRDAADKRIELGCSHDGAGVTIRVRDHGPGVPARHLAKIFEPFYRGESELTRRNQGTGLGLALVRGLVERMGARVSGGNRADGGFEVKIAFRTASA
ncbi:MAG TPA: HAMP domain-containing sensor histidine kinase [Candidatus Margulisiibacteriota bacterium]|nr:HAMP domain-containing sensor histidine kinase [Candidatus Margulisiibacteriota bacterium]